MLIICNGMIRSGSTLQYNIVRELVERLELGTIEGFYTLNQLVDNTPHFSVLAQDDAYHVIKCHSLHPDLPDLIDNGSVRVCYTYRDLRDVAVSAKRKWSFNDGRLWNALDHAVKVFDQLDRLRANGAPILMQRYEDFVNDVPGMVRNLATFIGLEPSSEMIATVTEACSMQATRNMMEQLNEEINSSNFRRLIHQIERRAKQALRRLGISVGFIATFDERTLIHTDHISETAGESGIWRNLLSDEEKGYINQHYDQWLEKMDYVEQN